MVFAVLGSFKEGSFIRGYGDEPSIAAIVTQFNNDSTVAYSDATDNPFRDACSEPWEQE